MPASTLMGLAVHVVVGEELHNHRGQLVGGAQPLGEQHSLSQAGLELLALLTGAVDRRVVMSPGAMVLTLTPRGTRGRELWAGVMPTTPPLEAE